MKILPLITNKAFTPTQNQQTNFVVKNTQTPLQQDIFVKSQEVSFGAQTTIQKKVMAFMPEISDLILNSEKLDLKDIEKVVQRHSPKTKVEPFSEKPKGIPINSGAGACFNAVTSVGNEGIKTISKSIYLKTKDLNLSSSEKQFCLLNAIIHEMIHIFQEESSNRMSSQKFLKKIFAEEGLTFEEKIALSNKLNNLSSTCENEIQGMLPIFLDNFKGNGYKYVGLGIPHPIDTDFASFSQFFYEKYGYPGVLQIPAIINKVFREVSENGGLIRPKLALERVLKKFKDEREAYKITTDIIKSKMGINSYTDWDLRNQLYDSSIGLISSPMVSEVVLAMK